MNSVAARAFREVLTIPTYTRHPARQLPVLFKEGPGNFYPATQDDILGGPRQDVDYEAIVLENALLKITITPELGGKIFSVFDKRVGKDVVYAPELIKPGLIYTSGAWVPGGMEFNFPYGHSIRAMRPLPCAILERGPETATAMVLRTCERTGLQLEIRVKLRAGEARFDIEYAFRNPTALTQRWYQWTNVGIRVGPRWRFFSKAQWQTAGTNVNPYPINERGVDTSWCVNRQWSADAFMLAHQEDFFGYFDYDLDVGICHVAPWNQMRGKKYFTWGNELREQSPWVFSDDGQDYLEIQTGILETQSKWDFLRPGEGFTTTSTWIPYNEIGGIEWADRDLIFNVKDGEPWLFPARDMVAGVTIWNEAFDRELKAGNPVRLPISIDEGDQVAITVDGEVRRDFAYPMKGNQEPDGLMRIQREYIHRAPKEPEMADEWLKRGRDHMLQERHIKALECFDKARCLDPDLHEATLWAAEAKWHMADFEGGVEDLCRLVGTPSESEAMAMLRRRRQAEDDFVQPINAVPEGPARELVHAERLAGHCAFEQAFEKYQDLIEAQPDNWRAHYGMAFYQVNIRKDKDVFLRHARRALSLKPGHRDLIIELTHMMQRSAFHEEVIDVIESAPAEVGALPYCRKLLADSYLETDRIDECWEIISREKLHVWEGEVRHLDVYRDCASALVDRALTRFDLSAARRIVEKLKTVPQNLGIVRRRYDRVRTAYWDGLVTAAEGDWVKAREVWRDGAASQHEELKDFEAHTGMSFWALMLPAEVLFYHVMCAKMLGDEELAEQAWDAIQRYENTLPLFKQPVPPYLNGLKAELRGEYSQAAGIYRQHLRTAAQDLNNARRHLTAVVNGERLGERFVQSTKRGRVA